MASIASSTGGAPLLPPDADRDGTADQVDGTSLPPEVTHAIRAAIHDPQDVVVLAAMDQWAPAIDACLPLREALITRSGIRRSAPLPDEPLWTPLLDAVATRFTIRPERLHSIARWLRREASATDALALLAYQTPIVRRAVAQHAGTWDAALLHAIWHDPDPELGIIFCGRGPAIVPHASAAFAWGSRLLASPDVPWATQTAVLRALMTLVEAGARPDSALVTQLVSVAAKGKRVKRHVVPGLLALEDLTPEELTTIHEAFPGHPLYAAAIMAHRAASPALVRAVVAQVVHPGVGLAIVTHHPEFLADREVWSALCRVPSSKLLAALLPFASATEFPEVLLALARQSPRRALDVLAAGFPPDVRLSSAMAEEIFLALLRAPTQDLRFRAMEALSVLPREDATAPSTHEPSATTSAAARGARSR